MKNDRERIFQQSLDDGRILDLEVDANNNLWWGGRKLVSEQKISLHWWVNIAIALGAIATIVLAAVSILEYLG